MKVLKIYIKNSPLRNFNYIIYSEVNQQAIFIDPLDIDQTLPYLKNLGLKAKYLLNTHYHPDHIKDNEKLLKLYPDVEEIKIEDRDCFHLSETEKIQSFYTPGHLDPHYCFKLLNNEKAFGVITGDILFNAGIGNARQGDVNVLYKTISEVVMKFDNDLIVYPAHDYLLTNLKFSKTIESKNEKRDKLLNDVIKEDDKVEYHTVNHTIGDEKEINPFLRLSELKESTYPELNEKDIFLKIRKLRDQW